MSPSRALMSMSVMSPPPSLVIEPEPELELDMEIEAEVETDSEATSSTASTASSPSPSPSSSSSPLSSLHDATPPREVAPFLQQLRTMLDTESDAVIRWTPDGRAFEIHDMAEMMAAVLPKYFKHRKYTSFQRQLNYFHFRKWTKSKAVVCTFSNDEFQRDRPELAWRITRKKSIHAQAKAKAQAQAQAQMTYQAHAHAQMQMQAQRRLHLQGDSSSPLSFFAPVMWKCEYEPADLSAFASSPPSPSPSPSDVRSDMVLLDNDVCIWHPSSSPSAAAARAHANARRQHPYYDRTLSRQSSSSLDPLDWFDDLMPSMDVAFRLDSGLGARHAAPSLASSSYAPPSFTLLPSASGSSASDASYLCAGF